MKVSVGVRRPVEIIVDTWGIPHIYAETVEDAFIAQGFNAARDRLFQIDLWRRRGLGLLSEVLGPDYVERDRAARLFLYRGEMAREWTSYGPDTEAIATSFTSGINAYVDWLDTHPEALPPEFELLGYRPAYWQPDDIVRIRSHGIVHNLLQEVARARVTNVAGLQADLVRQRLQPARQPHLAEGVDLDLPPEILRVFELATQPLVFSGDPRAPLGAAAPSDPTAEGSNNWVVAGSRTTTGRPILASDPHRTYATPSLRYVAHLSAPGLEVIGAGEPALPGVTAGHNGQVAFGFTIFPVDVQDLYVYELDTTDPTRYRYADGWEELRIIAEKIPVKGEPSRQCELAFTRHGPVIHVDQKRHRAYAVRSTWSEPGTAPYLGSLAYLQAQDVAAFRAALRGWGGPGENHVYADVDGAIGWTAAALVPRRPEWDGLLPVPGDGRYEWDGFHASEEFPEILNPAEGFVATANQFNLPEGFPADRHLSYEWPDPARHRRIVEVLSASEPHSLTDSMRLQTDVKSVAAREIVGVLATLHSEEPATASALELLRGWDAVESADSAAAALYEYWISRHLMPAFAEASSGARARSAAAGVVDYTGMRDELLSQPGWEPLMLSTLGAAYAALERLLGKDSGAWRWGDLHRNQQPHPLGFLDPSFEVGPIPVGGSGTTVNAAPYLSDEFVQTIGASFRMVLDVGAWDDSVVINTPGQSGDPRSPHYRDLLESWRRGAYIPLLYSRGAVERHAATRITLEPQE
ncbi:penicillin acylase family protein [Actinopolymorpha alba]|uniref:penicillin acylase family protein n=1 Tax=Actinopolymorpha alba TaxID=533267 RepID=UPI0005914223|nr:penicillin acylase family protein [Actinopolymorpha alba]